jgi:hypothetical protein
MFYQLRSASARLPALSVTVITFALAGIDARAAIINLSAGIYQENFDLIASSVVAGWDVRTGAAGTSMGTVGASPTTHSTWGESTGGFKNFASASTGSTSSTVEQAAATDRALGVRQTGTFGDPGASFNFQFSTSGLSVQSITIDLQLLNLQTRSTPWSIQYGIGANPTSFTTLASYVEPAAFGTTTFGFSSVELGEALTDQAQVWFRVAALSAASGSGNRDSIAIDNFSITTASIPEPSLALIGSLGFFALLRRRRC